MSSKKETVKETIEEFLARGGEVEIVPQAEREEEKIVIKPQAGGPPQLMSLTDGQHFFAEKKKSKKKKKTGLNLKNVNMDLVPDSLKSMLKNMGEKDDKQ